MTRNFFSIPFIGFLLPKMVSGYKNISLWILIVLLSTSCSMFGGKGNGEEPRVGDGEVAWRNANTHENITGTQPFISDNEVYYLQDGLLKATTLQDGKAQWGVIIDGNDDYSRKMLKSDNKLFLDSGFRIRAFDIADGSRLWTAEVADASNEISGIGSPIMSQDASYLYAGRKGYVVQVRKSDGQVTRRYPLDKQVPEGVIQGSTEPIISPFGDGTLYAPASYYDRTTPGEEEFGANIFAFEASTGDLKWVKKVEYKIADIFTDEPDDSVLVSPPIYDMELTESSIVVLHGKAIVALNRSSGDIRWVTNFPDSGFDVGLAVKDGSIYAASVGGFAHKLDLQTGQEIWRRDINFSNTSIPTVQNGRLYFNNSGGGFIWVLDIQDGSVIYHEPPPDFENDDFDVYISSLAVGEGYMVNVGSQAVYCLKVP